MRAACAAACDQDPTCTGYALRGAKCETSTLPQAELVLNRTLSTECELYVKPHLAPASVDYLELPGCLSECDESRDVVYSRAGAEVSRAVAQQYGQEIAPGSAHLTLPADLAACKAF